VILETGELADTTTSGRASWLAMAAGADFVKTSTGKISPAATGPVTLILLERSGTGTPRPARWSG